MIQESAMNGQQRKKKGSIKEHRGTIRDTQVANKGSAFHICHRPWQNSDVFESHVVSCLSFNLKPFDTAREKTLKEHKKTLQCYDTKYLFHSAGRSFVHNHLQGCSWPISFGTLSNYIVFLTTMSHMFASMYSNGPEILDSCI